VLPADIERLISERGNICCDGINSVKLEKPRFNAEMRAGILRGSLWTRSNLREWHEDYDKLMEETVMGRGTLQAFPRTIPLRWSETAPDSSHSLVSGGLVDLDYALRNKPLWEESQAVF
jgi:hypothetical protein